MPEIADIPVPASALSSADPFPGLRPYGEEDANWFYGRSAEVNDLLKRLRRLHFIAVVGASGSGKSSIVRAGLLPQIRDGYLDAEWRIATFRPGEQPIANLAASLDMNIDSGPESLLRSGPAGLVRALQQTGFAARQNFLIVVDQFEELFQFAQRKSDAAQEEIKEFLKLLLTAATSDDVAVYVIVTMRLEWLNECATYTGLAEAINEGIYLVPQMQRRQFGQAILGPLEGADGSLTSALLDRMLNDLDNRSDQLPVLQHALLRLWAREHTEEPFDVADYEAVGTFSHCLSNHAQEVYDGLTDKQKQIAEVLFRNITQVNKSRKIRRPRPLGEIQQAAHVDLAELVPVVLAFSRPGRSFLVTTQGAFTPASIIDISHEALIRQWTLLNEWVESEAEIQARLTRLYEDAAEWDRDRPHSQACLYTGVRLTRAEELAPQLDSSSPAPDFLRASERAHFWVKMRRVGIVVLVLVSVMAAVLIPGILITREQSKEAEKEAKFARDAADRQNAFEQQIKQQFQNANGASKEQLGAILKTLDAKRIYVQYTAGQAAIAQSVQSKLQRNNFAVPGIEQVSADKAPSTTQVRYFNAQDKAEATSIATMLHQWVPGNASVQATPNPRNAVLPGQFEVWLAAPAAGSASPAGSPAMTSTASPPAVANPVPSSPYPPTFLISATPTHVQKGGEVIVRWKVENATELDLDGVGQLKLDDMTTFKPQQTTTYRFTAKGNGETVRAITITVDEPPSPVAAPPAAPATATAASEAPSNDATQIEQVIQSYKAAYESESLDEMKKVWPSLGGAQQSQLKKTFDQFNAIRLGVTTNSQSLKVNGNIATVTVRQTANFTQRGQVLPPMVSTNLFSLRKLNGKWVLDGVK